MHIDWAKLATDLKCEGRGSTRFAQEAIADIFGDDAIIEAVEYLITGGSGEELARNVLWHIRPKAGMNYCYRIYKDDQDIGRRRLAVHALKSIADKRAIEWAPEFLNDPDTEIQSWGACMVDQLLWCNFVDEDDCQELLATMKGHDNTNVRETHDWICTFLSDRAADCEPSDAPNEDSAGVPAS